MAWPRIKQPDEPDPESGQNAGVSGTRRSVAEPGDTRGHNISDGGSRGFRALLGPIRYAHGGNPPGRPPAPRSAAAETVPAEVLSSEYDYDQTAGLVYEDPSHYPGPADDAPQDAPRNEGIGIFGGMGSADEPQEPPALPYAAYADGPYDDGPYPDGGYRTEPAAHPPTAEVSSVGATWNEPITGAPQPVDARPGQDRQSRAFSLLRGGLRLGPPAPDDQPQVRVRDLPPDVQMRFYRLRATITVVVFLLFLVLLRNWEIALTLAILAGIVDTVYRSRTAGNYANGASWGGARRRTRRQLARMRRAGYYALDARPIPNSREFIDHLVVGPTGVYAIDSEKWDAKLPIRTWNGKKLYHGPESQKGRLEHAVWEAQQASEILSAALGYEVKVRPALAIYGPKIPWDIATIRDVDVFTGPALGKYLKRRGRMRDGVTPLTSEQVRTIYDTASRMLPDVSAARPYTPVG
jgi:hypothetical protein